MESSSGFLPSPVIDCRPCWRLPALIAVCVLLALTALEFGRPGPRLRLTAAVLIIGCGIRELRRVWPLSGGQFVLIQVGADGRFQAERAGAGGHKVTVEVTSFWVLRGIATGLSFIDGAGTPTGGATLFRDRHPPDAWRRLHVHLRHPPRSSQGL